MMKRFFLLTWIIFFLFDSSESATTMQEAAVHPDHPGKCYMNYMGEDIFLSPGGAWTSGDCEQITCDRRNQNSNELLLYIASCGVMGYGNGPCKLHKDLSLPYPDCCKYECSDLVD
ncbi:uncharacterized protein LOC136038770 [Artemia franciscana]|uniref:uncharacterized protein LOC136038770 n=1 Tax=Artemia franciscana TaxID=6661 RepID=UPI0032DADD12